MFKYIKISGRQRLKSFIKGHDPKRMVQNIIFENIEMDGKIIQSLEEGKIFVDPKTTKNVRVFAKLKSEIRNSKSLTLNS